MRDTSGPNSFRKAQEEVERVCFGYYYLPTVGFVSFAKVFPFLLHNSPPPEEAEEA